MMSISLQRKHFGHHKHRSPSGIYTIAGACSNLLPLKRMTTGFGYRDDRRTFTREDFAISGSDGNFMAGTGHTDLKIKFL